MKKFISLLKAQLFIAVLIFSAKSFAQVPVVQVPPGCTVVYVGPAGIGTLGAGGKVGHGGIITMPDPYGGDQFAFLPNNGGGVINTVGTWRLLGDLSDTNNATTSDAPVQPAGTPLLVKIMSYNKKSRTAEYPPVSPNSSIVWARSKGRVTVSYTNNNNCGNSLVFDVYKTFVPLPNATAPTNIPKIVGPDCLLPNTQYTYSVDQIVSDNAGDAIGFDSYYWSGFPTGYVNSYFSADKSSVTFTTGSTIPPSTVLRCDYGRANPWDGDTFAAGAPHNTYVKKPLGISPVTPTLTPALNVNPGLNCLPTNIASYTTTITPITGYVYVWTSTNNAWQLTQSGTQNSILTITNLDNNPGTLTLTITNGSCNPAIFTYTINRTLAPALGITGLGGVAATTCISAATSYSLPQNALGNSTNWTIDTVPTGGVLPAGAPTVANGLGSGSTCTVTPGTASGAFTLIAKAKAITTCTTSGTSLVINIKPATPIFTTGSPSCIANAPSTITTIAINTTAPGTPTTGYVWDLALAPGWNISLGNGTSTPTFTQNGTTTGSATIKVSLTGANGCNSLVASLIVTYRAILTSFNPLAPFCDQYVLSCGSAASWTVNGANYTTTSGNITINGNNLSICGNGGTTINQVCANVTGIGAICASSFGTHTLRQTNQQTNESVQNTIKKVIVSPNPNNGNFNINVPAFNESALATLFTFSGIEIKTYKLRKGDNKIDNEGLLKGTYFVKLKIDAEEETRQIIIK